MKPLPHGVCRKLPKLVPTRCPLRVEQLPFLSRRNPTVGSPTIIERRKTLSLKIKTKPSASHSFSPTFSLGFFLCFIPSFCFSFFFSFFFSSSFIFSFIFSLFTPFSLNFSPLFGALTVWSKGGSFLPSFLKPIVWLSFFLLFLLFHNSFL